MPFPLRDIRKKSSQHVRACVEGDGAICSKNRKIVPYHGANPNTRNGARLRSPSPIMAPVIIHLANDFSNLIRKLIHDQWLFFFISNDYNINSEASKIAVCEERKIFTRLCKHAFSCNKLPNIKDSRILRRMLFFSSAIGARPRKSDLGSVIHTLWTPFSQVDI